MKFLTTLLALALAITAVSATATDGSVMQKRVPQVCSDGITYCDGCQCCPDGYLCANAPNTSSCPANSCPNGRSGSAPPASSTSAPVTSTSAPVNGICTATQTVTVTVTSTVTNGGSQPVSSTTTTTTQPTQPSSGGSASPTSHQVTVVNKCSYTVWPGLLGSSIVANGGWTLAPGASSVVTLPTGWSGRIWGRTGCNFDSNGRGFCASGDCGGVLQCNGAGGNPPATLAEITFNAHEGLDFYDVSLVDGYNLPLTFSPVQGTYQGTASGYTCTAPGCVSDLNLICPAALQKIVNGNVVACMSACEAFNTDLYCCRGAHDTPATCKTSSWPVDYSSIFKQACPTAYSYAYDDTTSTFTCTGAPQVDYQVTFCG